MTRFGQPRRRRFLAFGPLPRALRAAGFFALGACATAPAPAAREPAATLSRSEAAASGDIELDAELGWSRRGEPAQLARILTALTARTQRDPQDFAAWLKLAEAHALMADGIAVLGWRDRGEPSAQLAASEAAARTALALRDREAADALHARELAALPSGDAQAGAALYWLARSAYARAQLAGYEALLLDFAPLERALAAAAASAPSVDRGGPLRARSSMAAHPPDPSLRDLAAAKAHAERALSIAPESAANLLAYVEHYAVPAQDRAALAGKLAQLRALRDAGKARSPEDAIALARAEQLAPIFEGRLE